MIMGNYERAYQRIAELKQRKKELQDKVEALMEELRDIEIGIGECEGFLAELRYIDGEE